MVGCGIKAYCLYEGPGPLGGKSYLSVGLSKGFYIVFKQVTDKIKENYERLGRQPWSRIEPGTSRLPVWERNLLAIGGAIQEKHNDSYENLNAKYS